MVKFAEEDEDTTAVTILAEDYKADLDLLRELTPVIVTEIDIQRLRILASKYNVDGEINRLNFIDKLGEVSRSIRSSLEELAIEHVLESEKEDKPGKKPRKTQTRKESIPKSLEKR